MAWRSELPMMNIINMTLKNTTKSLIKMKQMTLNDPKFDIKKTRHPVNSLFSLLNQMNPKLVANGI